MSGNPETHRPLRGDLPRPIVESLRAVIQRMRWVILTRGIAAVVAVAAGSLLSIMAIDASVVLFSATTRWLLTLSAFLLTAAASIWFLVMPLAKTITLAGIARAIEEHHPELQERLSSAIELLTSRDLPSIRGSEALISALAAEATQDAGKVQPRAEITLRSARPFLIAAGAGLVIIIGIVALIPDGGQLLARAVAPFANTAIRDWMITVRPADDSVIQEKDRVTVDVTVKSRSVSRAEFRRVLPDGSESVEMMSPLAPADNGDARFSFVTPPATESFRYRIHVGDALTRFYKVTVVERTAIKRIQIKYEFPEYTRWESRVDADASGDIKALLGTRVTVTAETNRPVRTADLKINGQTPQGIRLDIAPAPGGTSVCTFSMTLTPELRGRWALATVDENNFANTSGEHALDVLGDTPPAVAMVLPQEKKIRVKPTDEVPIGWLMTDDVGLSGAEFTVETDTRQHSTVPLPLPAAAAGKPQREAQGQTPLDLSKLPLKGARQLTVRVRGTDVLPPKTGPQEGLSEILTIDLDVKAEAFEVQQLQAEAEALRQALERILAELRGAKDDSSPLKDTLAKTAVMSPDLVQRLDRMRGPLAQAKGHVADLGPMVAKGMFTGLTPKVNQLSTEVVGANDTAGQMKLVEAMRERITLAADTDLHVDKAIAITLDLLKELQTLREAGETALALEELAREQAELAEAKAAEENAQAAADWAQKEAELAKELAELIKDSPEAVKAAMAEMGQRAKDLAKEAAELQKKQEAAAAEAAKLEQLKAIDQKIQALAVRESQLGDQAAQISGAKEQAQPMQNVARELSAGSLPQAVQDQKQIEAALGQPPQAGQPQEGQPQGNQPAPQNAQQVAQTQQNIRRETENLMAQRQELQNQLMTAEMQRLQAEQAQLAQEANQLAQNVAPTGQQPAQQGQQAAQNAQQAANQMPTNMPSATQNAQQAAQQLGQLSQNLQNQANQAAQQEGQPQEQQPQEAQPQENQPQEGQPQEGAPKAGEAGAPKAGEAGAPKAGEAGAPKAGEVGAPKAGGAGTPKAGGAGTPKAGGAGTPKAGGAGTPKAGGAGTPKAGGAGAPKAGGAGAPKAGSGQGQGQGQGQPSASQMANMAQQAQDLANRQQELATQMAAMSQGNPQQSLATEQNSLQAQTNELQQEAAALNAEAQQLSAEPAASQQATQAAQSLGQAAQQAQAAAAALGQNQPQTATAAEQAAAQALQNAAQALAAMGQMPSMQSGPASQPPTSVNPNTAPGQPMAGQPMAQALASANQAAQAQTPASASQASAAMAAAAAQAASAAQSKGVGMGKGMTMGMPGRAGDPKMGTGNQATSLTASKLEAMGISVSDWAKLPGELRDQILQAADETGPEEYRAMIRRYFQEVARRGGQSEGKK
jgi:hypothetical protein